MEDVIYLPFSPMSLLKWENVGEEPTYWRYLIHGNDGADLWVLQVDPKVTPRSSRGPVCWKLNDIGPLINLTIRKIDDCVRLDFMNEKGWKLSVKDDAFVTLREEWVALLIGDGLEQYLSSEKFRTARLKEVSVLVDVSVPRLMAVLTRYFWYGGGREALYPLRPNQGGPQIMRLDTTQVKMGRPNANMVLDPNTMYRGANMQLEMREEWAVILEAHYPDGQEVSQCFVDYMLPRLRNIPGRLRPDKRLFLDHGYQIVKERKLKERRVGRIAWAQEHAARTGSATDGGFGAVDIYDLDGMEYNIYLVFGNQRLDAVGKPTVILAVCRRSRAVVGWYVTIRSESGNTYKHCLFSSFTSKARTLARLGITERLRGLVYGVCDAVYFDRGPGISMSVTEAVVNELKLDQAIAPPRRGDLKGVMEGVNGIFQRRTADLPGAYKRTGERADQERQDAAQEAATLTTLDFEKTLVYAINEYNLTADVDQILTNKMMEAGTKPNPASIFGYYRKKRLGGASKEWTERELYLRLLESAPKAVRSGKVQYGRGFYTSKELVEFYNDEMQRPRQPENPLICVRIPMDDATYLVWERDDGTFVELAETARTSERFGRALRFDRKLSNLFRRAQRRVQAAANAAGNKLANWKSELIQDSAEKATAVSDTYKTGASINQARRELAREESAARGVVERDVLGLPVGSVQTGEAEFGNLPEPRERDDPKSDFLEEGSPVEGTSVMVQSNHSRSVLSSFMAKVLGGGHGR